MFPFEFKIPEGQVGSALWLVVALMSLVNFLMAIFWIVLGWRAMRAHERLPEVLAATLRDPARGRGSESGPAA